MAERFSLRAREGETRTVGRVHGRAWLDGMQHLATYRAFRVDVHAKSVERRTRSADRFFFLASSRTGSSTTPGSTKTRTHVATDHRAVCVELSTKMQCATKPNITKHQRSLNQWKLGHKWRCRFGPDWTSCPMKVRDSALEKSQSPEEVEGSDTYVPAGSIRKSF